MAATALAFAFEVGAWAQAQCSTSQINQPCDGGIPGTCIPATCTTTVNGVSSATACGACFELGPDDCLPSQVGMPCGDAGGTCMSAGGAGAGSGSGPGADAATPQYMIAFSTASCVAPGGFGGSGEVDAGISSEVDAGASTATGGSTVGGGGGGDNGTGRGVADSSPPLAADEDAATHEESPAGAAGSSGGGGGSGGCAISGRLAGGSSRNMAAALGFIALAFARPRGRSARRRR
ncbi:MAG: hypothetical protein ABSC94_26640 [Polyangiaceae bacterium]